MQLQTGRWHFYSKSRSGRVYLESKLFTVAFPKLVIRIRFWCSVQKPFTWILDNLSFHVVYLIYFFVALGIIYLGLFCKVSLTDDHKISRILELNLSGNLSPTLSFYRRGICSQDRSGPTQIFFLQNMKDFLQWASLGKRLPRLSNRLITNLFQIICLNCLY